MFRENKNILWKITEFILLVFFVAPLILTLYVLMEYKWWILGLVVLILFLIYKLNIYL